MTRPESRKTRLVEALGAHLLRAGLGSATLRPMARAIGTSDRMLLYYFPTKEALLAEVLVHVSRAMKQSLDALRPPGPLPPDVLLAHFRGLLLSEPMRLHRALFLEIAARAARGEAGFRAIGQQIAAGFLDWIAGQLDLPDPAARALAARRILTQVEGLILLDAVGIEGAT